MGLSVDNNKSNEVSKVSQPKTETQPTNNNPTTLNVISETPTDAGRASKIGESQTSAQQIKQSVEANVNNPNDITSEATVTRVNGEVIIDAGGGNDQIAVTQNATTGDITVDVNGASRTFTGADRNNLVIRAGDGNDSIAVANGVNVSLRLEGQNGDDRISVDRNVSARQFISGGDGRDTLLGGAGDDKIEGGRGNDFISSRGGVDYVNGSFGDDTILTGDGNDVAYGGNGKDLIFGGRGDDYLEGSRGDDRIYGGTGTDVLSGGIGNDMLRGGTGDDVLYAGQGTDELYGDGGTNRIFSQTDDTVQASDSSKGITNNNITVELVGNPGATSVSVTGTAEFRERIEADLEMFRSSPLGREMLASFDRTQATNGTNVTIQEISSGGAWADWANRTNPTAPQPFLTPTFDGSGNQTGYVPGTPNSSTVGIEPDLMLSIGHSDGAQTDFLPNVVLYHELAHAYDFTNGTLRRETYRGNDRVDLGGRVSERVATGLPIDHDNNPLTPKRSDDAFHPDELTENALRDEMNQRRRSHYLSSALFRD